MSRGKQKPDAECRLSWLNVRLTISERTALEEKARAAGITTTELARKGLERILTEEATPAAPAHA